MTTFAAAVMTGSAHHEVAKRFVESLVTDTAFAAYEATMLDPARD